MPGHLMAGSQTAGADGYAAYPPVGGQLHLVDIGHEPGAGVALGVTDVVTPHADFATSFTFQRYDSSLTVARPFCTIQ